MVPPLSIKDFAALVEKTRVIEKMKNEVEGQRPQQPQRIGGPSGSKPRHDERRRPYDRPHYQPQGSRSLPPQQGRVLCYICGGPPIQTPHQHQRRDKGNRPQTTSMVYAMSGAEATGSSNLVMGSCMIAGTSCWVLYDSGATHSFVLDACVKSLGLPVCEL